MLLTKRAVVSLHKGLEGCSLGYNDLLENNIINQTIDLR